MRPAEARHTLYHFLYEFGIPACSSASAVRRVASPRACHVGAVISLRAPTPLLLYLSVACLCRAVLTQGRDAPGVPPGRSAGMSGLLSHRQQWLRLVSRAQARGFARGAVGAPADRGKGAEVKGGGGEKKVGGDGRVGAAATPGC